MPHHWKKHIQERAKPGSEGPTMEARAINDIHDIVNL